MKKLTGSSPAMLLAGLTCCIAIIISACASKIASEEPLPDQTQENAPSNLANVVSVRTTGSATNFQFSVGISSPDEDCDQYANWWEVVTPEGELVYRRILLHSHPTEQPFIRSGGPVAIDAEDEVIVRAFMHPTGYGGTAYRGSISDGFQAVQLPADFAASLSEAAPLPTICTG